MRGCLARNDADKHQKRASKQAIDKCNNGDFLTILILETTSDPIAVTSGIG